MQEMLRSLDMTVRLGFAKLDAKLNVVQNTLKTITDDVENLKSSVAIVEGDLNDVKKDVIPKLEEELKKKIAALDHARLESELYTKKSNFNSSELR